MDAKDGDPQGIKPLAILPDRRKLRVSARRVVHHVKDQKDRPLGKVTRESFLRSAVTPETKLGGGISGLQHVFSSWPPGGCTFGPPSPQTRESHCSVSVIVVGSKARKAALTKGSVVRAK